MSERNILTSLIAERKPTLDVSFTAGFSLIFAVSFTAAEAAPASFAVPPAAIESTSAPGTVSATSPAADFAEPSGDKAPFEEPFDKEASATGFRADLAPPDADLPAGEVPFAGALSCCEAKLGSFFLASSAAAAAS